MGEPWGKDKSLEEKMVWDFRNTFLRDDNTIAVLLTLGELMHFFDDEIETEEERILSNFYKKILVYCGIWWKPNGIKILKGLDNEKTTIREKLIEWIKNIPVPDFERMKHGI